MHFSTLRLILIPSFLLFSASLFAQVSPGQYWEKIPDRLIPHQEQRDIIPQKERLMGLDLAAWGQLLQQAPDESFYSPYKTFPVSLPTPDGRWIRVNLVHSSIMEKPLQEKYPEIRTYAGRGIENPAIKVRMDITPQGFHAMILSPEGAIFIDPYSRNRPDLYSVYWKKDFVAVGKQMVCHFEEPGKKSLIPEKGPVTAKKFGDCQVRSYRLALAGTAEYTAYHGGTVALAQAAMVTSINRVNAIMERDLSIRLVLIANNDTLIYTNAGSDPYSNGSAGTMLSENQSNINSVIGAANYDIGHVFGTNSGGVAGFGVVCNNNQKARGVTGSSNPIGDPFDIDYVAHEVGHQFAASHTFNGTAGACGGNGSGSSAYEPGSGSTIMAYAGICGSQNVQSNSDAHYHARSLLQIGNFVTNTSCATIITSANSAPVVSNPTQSYTIPAGTTFFLDATATDVDADSLTYCWEQYDNQSSTQPPVASSTTGPNFRSFDPTPDPRRYFPRIDDIVANNTPTWEVIPDVGRTMDFRVSVRDNALPGGCTDHGDATITVDGNSGPFVLTSPSDTGITYLALSSQLITWNVAGSDQAPVNASTVDILLSTDGGFTYPVTVASGVPNTGSFSAIIPNNPTTTARIMVVGSNNVFFDISNNDFEIIPSVPDFSLLIPNPLPFICSGNNGTVNLDVTSILGFTDTVNLSVSLSPNSPMNASLQNTQVVPGGFTNINLTNTANAPGGNYTLTVTGSSSTGSKSIIMNFNLIDGPPPAPTLDSPQDTAIGVSPTPLLSWDPAQGATSYQVQVAADPNFSTLIVNDSLIPDTFYQVTNALNNATFYYWRVIATNPCGNSVSTPFSFVTGNISCQTLASVDVPKNIPNSVTTISSDLNFPNSGSIQSVKVVNLSGTHTYISDLVFRLISPSGTQVVLIDEICSNENNFNINLEDGASAYNNIPCPPTDGLTYEPLEALSAFQGEDPQGTWTLEVDDVFPQDGGSLNAWGLEICYAAGNSCVLNISPAILQLGCTDSCDATASMIPTGGNGDYSFIWSSGSTDSTLLNVCPGSYHVVVQDSSGCLGGYLFSLGSPTTFNVAVAGQTDVSCFGAADGTASLSFTGGAAPYTEDWGGLNPNALPAGSHVVYVEDANQCLDSVVVVIGQPAQLSLNLGPDITICQGSNLILNAGNDPQTTAYQWSTGAQTQTISVQDSGLYSVLITQGGCQERDSIYVSVVPVPVVGFSFSINGPTVTFQNSSSSGVYLWNFGDGVLASSTNPIHVYTSTGTYQVSLVVTDNFGCKSDTLVQDVVINSLTDISRLLVGQIKAFPNPMQDQLKIEIKNIPWEGMEFHLQNHLGQIVARKRAPGSDFEWDISPLASGVYYLGLSQGAEVYYLQRLSKQ
ncbi:MAG: reprolysin-like metallopeptidase [Bacteroidota bacterium]